METEKYKQITSVVEALHTELKPTYLEIENLVKALETLSDNNTGSKEKPLSQLILRLTTTSRRHNLTDKILVNRAQNHKLSLTIGTNHQGLGIERSYSTQLSPLVSNSRYSQDEYDEQTIRDILFDEDAVIELTSILKKSNQKIFLKTLKILKENKIVEAFDIFKHKNINQIDIPIGDDGYKIVIDLNRGFKIDFEIKNKDDDTIASVDVRVGKDNEINPKLDEDEEDDDILKPMSNSRSQDFSLSDIQTLLLLSQHTDAIKNTIQEKTKLLNSVMKKYRKETNELNDLLQPLLALEKL